ncbi:hypothetical protein [Bifidobacterium callitrichidarum]|uniref:hypothetical protein n=1 Tax=Bifidobacterium callitrichidarum TaxID=2052941 RepID=UPI0011B262FB|nr:hypothetical protein [Bifidobacterium callitrichidarum]
MTCKVDAWDEDTAISICQEMYPGYDNCEYYDQGAGNAMVICTDDSSSGGGTDTGTKLTATISYDLNGGTGSFADQSKTSNKAGSFTFNLRKGKPTAPAGKVFLGWSLSKPDSTTAKPSVLQPGDQLIVQYGATITMYALYGSQATLNDCVVQMPTTGAPDGLNALGAASVVLAAVGTVVSLRRRVRI